MRVQRADKLESSRAREPVGETLAIQGVEDSRNQESGITTQLY